MLACARGQSAEERQLREALTRVQADHDRIEQRLTALEVRPLGEPNETPAPASTTPTPKLPVVRLTPELTPSSRRAASAAVESTEDPAPRPAVRIIGGGRGARRGEARAEVVDQLSDGEPAPSSGSGNPSALDPKARRAYDAALALVNAKAYDRALDAFAGFLVNWPDHPNADNAMYWRGECYFAKGEYDRALEQFDGLLARFPLGNKASDALLKAGMCRQRLGDGAGARKYFERLGREFPRSEALRRIPREENK